MTHPEPSRFQETTAMLLIGDGVLGLLRPSAHCDVWRIGAQKWDTALEWFAERPRLVRVCAAVEVAAGLWLAQRQFARSASGLNPRTMPVSEPAFVE
jgi:hypothetical protein